MAAGKMRFLVLLLLPVLAAAQAPRLMVPTGHTQNIYTAVFSPDGRRVITGSYDRTAKIWDAETGKQLANLKGHEWAVTRILFCLNGQRLITSSLASLKLWDAKTGLLVRDLVHPRKGKDYASINGLAISPDGSLITACLNNGRLVFWNGSDGSLLKEWNIGDPAYSIFFSSDMQFILTQSHDHTAVDDDEDDEFDNKDHEIVQVWDLKTRRLLIQLNDQMVGPNSCSFIPGSTGLLSVSNQGRAALWDFMSQRMTDTLEGPVDCTIKAKRGGGSNSNVSGIGFFVFSKDGKKIFQAGKIWDRFTGRRITDQSGFPGWPRRENENPVLDQYYQIGTDTLRLFGLSSGKLQFTITEKNLDLFRTRYSPDGKRILTQTKNHRIRIWDTRTGKIISGIEGHAGKIESLITDPGADRVTIRVDDADFYTDTTKMPRVKQVDLKTAAITRNWVTNYTLYSSLISPDGKMLAFERGNDLIIQSLVTGELLARFELSTSDLISSSFSDDCSLFLLRIRDPKDFRWETDKHSLKIWSFKDRKFCFELPPGEMIRLALTDHANRRLITASKTEGMKVWDIASGNILHSLAPGNESVASIRISPDDTKAGFIRSDASLQVLDLQSGKILVTASNAHSAEFSPDSRWIVSDYFAFRSDDPGYKKDTVTAAWSSEFNKESNKGKFGSETERFYVNLVDLQTGYIKILTGYKQPVFSPDSRSLLVLSSNDSFGVVRNVMSDKVAARLKGPFHFGRFSFSKSPGKWESKAGGLFSPDGQLILTLGRKKTVWNSTTGELITRIGDSSMYDDWDHRFFFTSDSKRLIAANASDANSIDDTIDCWDPRTGRLLMRLMGHEGACIAVIPQIEKKLILSASEDRTLRVWDYESGKLKYTFIATDSTGYLTTLPAGYYQCTGDAAKLLHYVTGDLKVITFEQLDVKYNRPDKVLEAAGNTDTSLIKSYRKAWEKRIKKLGIDTTAFRDGYSVPECDFANRELSGYEQTNGELRLHIRGIDSSYLLDRFNIWINESPLYGQRGISIRRKRSNRVDTTITIRLSQGVNRIEASITNVNGTESYRMPLYVNYTPAVRQKESLRFIGIGIDRFSDKTYNLQYSSKDIRDLALKLKEKYKDNIIIDTLFNQNVTTENVKALKEKLKLTTVNDKVIISYSGHGLLSREYDYYLSTYSINFDKPEENGLPYDELESLLDSIPARKKLMLIDACHSGEVDKEEMVRITDAEDSLSKQGTKGGKPRFTGKTTLGMKNSFELMQSLFVNVGKSTGATIISAAAGTQFALERGDLKNGVFTYCMLEAMDKNPSMKISELKRIVGERVEQLTNGLQKPTSRNETIAVDWTLW